VTDENRRIPVNLVTGFLGVGKTTALKGLMARCPSAERWAVLVNEFGEVGIDGALLAGRGFAVEEVAGGCLCCVMAPAFTTGLNRLIRRERPDRILIEPSGLGHPARVLGTLSGPIYAGVLEVRATVCLMDARHLASARHRGHPSFQDQIHLADVLLANKADLYAAHDITAFEDFAARLNPPKQRFALTEGGGLDPAWLDLGCRRGRQAAFPEAHAFLIESAARGSPDSTDVNADWILIQGGGDGYRRVGWVIRQNAPWGFDALREWIDVLQVERKKGLFNTDLGWQAVNQSGWSAIDAPHDGRARLELIDPETMAADAIDASLRHLATVAGVR
jgi:G3E family GTPase